VSQGQSLRFRVEQSRRIARPAPEPLLGLAAEPGCDWIREDIPDRIRKVFVALDHPGREALLEQMAFPTMPLVEPLRVDPEQTVHCRRQLLLPPFDEHVEVGAQQAPGVEA